MKEIISEERRTGMGATHFTAVLLDGEWVKVSDLKNARYLGRFYGMERWTITVPDETVTAHFYRSNRGNEHVVTSTGEEFFSFSEARRWASDLEKR